MAADDPIPALDLTPEITEYWDQLVVAVTDVLRSGQFILGPQVAAFEDEIAGYLGVEHAIGVNSCTDALVLALRALDVGEGDEVITTPSRSSPPRRRSATSERHRCLWTSTRPRSTSTPIRSRPR